MVSSIRAIGQSSIRQKISRDLDRETCRAVADITERVELDNVDAYYFV